MSLTSPRLVETVMINVADFAESFLTCSTCLSGYDAGEHSPKLLPCSHTICRTCLERILETSVASGIPGSSSSSTAPYHRTATAMTNAGASSSSSSASLLLQTSNGGTATFRCPICREGIAVPPRGGAASFPPAFIVNQLLDVMARQRRDLVPKCAQHPALELLFCETCDVVFCSRCGLSPPLLTANSAGASDVTFTVDSASPTSIMSPSSGRSSLGVACCSAQHNVVTFSVALKRCSEILLHKASLGLEQLNEAQEAVAAEMSRLEENTTACIYTVNDCFEDVISQVRQMQQLILEQVTEESLKKRAALSDQLTRIEVERRRIQSECDELNQVVDVRRISKGISALNEKLDQLATLSEPRVNAFLRYKRPTSLQPVRQALQEVCGAVLVSSTYPPLCRLLFHTRQHVTKCEPPSDIATGSSPICLQWVAHFRQEMSLVTVDNCGQTRVTGGDPVEVQFQAVPQTETTLTTADTAANMGNLSPSSSNGGKNEVHIRDSGDGTYHIRLLAAVPGVYRFTVRVLERPVRRFLQPESANGESSSTSHHTGSTLTSHPLHKQGSQTHTELTWPGSGPLLVQVVASQPRPVWSCRQSTDGRTLCQPFAVVCSPQRLYPAGESCPAHLVHVLDTGNNRLVTLKASDGHSVCQAIVPEVFQGQSATGLALHCSTEPLRNDAASTASAAALVWVTNWRLKQLILLNLDRDEVLYRINCGEFVEPSSVHAFPVRDGEEEQRFLVIDNGARSVWLVSAPAATFECTGTVPTARASCHAVLKLPTTWGIVNGFVCWPPTTEQPGKDVDVTGLILATTHLLQFCRVRLSATGNNDTTHSVTLASGHFGGVAIFHREFLLATRNDRSGAFVRVFQSPSIDSDKTPMLSFYDVDTAHCGSEDGQRPLRRLAGLVPLTNQEAAVVDLAGHCVARLRYA